MRFRNKFHAVQLHKLQIFTRCFTSTILHFLVKHSGTQHAPTFVINKCSRKIVLMEPVLMPTVSAISCTFTWRFSVTIFSTARQFSLQIASGGRPTGAQLQGFFCLDETRLLSAWPWHVMAHLHRTQQSYGCVSAVAECSPVSKILSLDDSGFC